MMFDLEQMERTIKAMRAQAQQLTTAADGLETMIEPWRQTQNMITQANDVWGQWAKFWTHQKNG
jgi:prefoldin subunit 5